MNSSNWPTKIDANNEYGGAVLRKVQGKTALYKDPVHNVFVVFKEGWIFVAEEKRRADAMAYMDEEEKSYFTDENHPNPNDNAQGSHISFVGDNEIEIITWTRYAPSIGEYNATLARFLIDWEHKTLTLERISYKPQFAPWNENVSNPFAYVTDTMARRVRDFIARESGEKFWRIK